MISNTKSGHIEIQSGEQLLLYTDGINEAPNEAGKMFGIARLHDLMLAADSDVKQIGNPNRAGFESICSRHRTSRRHVPGGGHWPSLIERVHALRKACKSYFYFNLRSLRSL